MIEILKVTPAEAADMLENDYGSNMLLASQKYADGNTVLVRYTKVSVVTNSPRTSLVEMVVCPWALIEEVPEPWPVMDELLEGFRLYENLLTYRVNVGCGLSLIGVEDAETGEVLAGPRLVRYREKFTPDVDYTQKRPR